MLPLPQGTAVAVAILVGSTVSSSSAEPTNSQAQDSRVRALDRSNGGTTGMAVGGMDGNDIRIASDINCNLVSRVADITKLNNEESHLATLPDIKSTQDIAGKKVSFDPDRSGARVTVTTVSTALGIKGEPADHDQAMARQTIKTGAIATHSAARKPARAVADLNRTDTLELLPAPFSEASQNVYPARIFGYWQTA